MLNHFLIDWIGFQTISRLSPVYPGLYRVLPSFDESLQSSFPHSISSFFESGFTEFLPVFLVDLEREIKVKRQRKKIL